MSDSVTLDFTGGNLQIDPGSPSFVYSLPASLDPNWTSSFSTSIASFPISGSINVSAGLTGGVDIGLGNYSPNIPVVIDPGLPTGPLSEGQIFSIDPTLISVEDASFSLNGPSATANLDLGLNGSLGFTFDQGGLFSFAVNPALSFGYMLPNSYSFSEGPLSITVAEPSGFSTMSAAGSSVGSLPTLTASGQGSSFLSASIDIVGALADILPDGLGALIDGSFDAGVASFSYSLLSAPLTAGLSLGDSVSLDLSSIGVTLQEETLGGTVLATDTGTLGSVFSFTAPDSGGGFLINAIYTLNYELVTTFGLAGSLTLSIDGPQVSGSVLGASGTLGPLGSAQLLSFGTGLGTIDSISNAESLTQSSLYTLSVTSDTICFLRGTHIATPSGEIPVEALKVGDLVSTLGGAARPVRWIGTGRQMLPAGRRSGAAPVIVRRDALAPGVPARDLRVTKGHALYLDGALFPVEFLVNHRSILWDDAAREAEFYHLELDAHDVLLAEGAPAESYRDDGNGRLFADAGQHGPRPFLPPCALVLTEGEKLDAVWKTLLARSGAVPVPTTREPDLHLLADGGRIEPVRQDGRVFVFRLPPGAAAVTIASRAAVPAEIGSARDTRRLGVGIAHIAFGGNDGSRHRLDAVCLTGVGFYAYEPVGDFTWTDGRAVLAQDLTGADWLEVHVRQCMAFPVVDVPIEQQAA